MTRARLQPLGSGGPPLTTRDCADRLGVTPGFIVGEIRSGRLVGIVLARIGRRCVYRVEQESFAAYVRRYVRVF